MLAILKPTLSVFYTNLPTHWPSRYYKVVTLFFFLFLIIIIIFNVEVEIVTSIFYLYIYFVFFTFLISLVPFKTGYKTQELKCYMSNFRRLWTK
jgi:hypothetical protein